MVREKKWGSFPVTQTASSAFENAKGEIDSLAEEMRDWEGNMSQSDGLTATEKYQTVSDAADALENAQSSLEEIEIPEAYESESVTFPEIRRKGYPRWVRLSNATAGLQAVADLLNEKGEEAAEEKEKPADDKKEKTEETEDFKEQARNAADEIQSVIDEVEGVDFPGMF